MSISTRNSPVTLQDVAREAGVSLATASRSLNGSARKVNDSYRQKVLDAAQRLGYSPNLSAQAVAKGATSTVALIVSDIGDPYFSSIAAGVIRAAEKFRLVVTMAVTERRPERELELVRTLRGQRPQVLILAGSRYAGAEDDGELTRELQAFEATGGRVVLVSQHEMPFDTVLINNYEGARNLAGALVDLGYRNFAAVTGVGALMTSGDRMRGFVDGLAARDIAIPKDRIVETEFTRDGGYAAAGVLIERGTTDVDVVFAVNDVMAIGVMSRFREAGIAVPQHIAVAGFDDIPTARDISPALTTVRLPLEELGSAAMELALAERVEGAPATMSMDGMVVVRESTPPR